MDCSLRRDKGSGRLVRSCAASAALSRGLSGRDVRSPLFFAAILSLLITLFVRADDTPAARAEALLRDLHLHGQLLKSDSPGTPAVSGAVAVGGKVVFSGGAGSIDLSNDVAARGDSVYNIGSTSKAITAIAVMQLVERGSVSLDDDIRKYVPEFPAKQGRITVWNLLTHTSGIRHYRKTDFPGTPDNENIRPDFDWLAGIRLFENDPLLFEPGKYYSYTSYGVNLLQGVVEKASGEPFERYLHDHIWAPAGAMSGSVDVPERIVPHRAHSYRFAGGKWLNYYYNDLHYKFASGAMIASAEDLVRVLIALNHGLLMRRETRTKMLASQLDGLEMFRDTGTEPMDFQQAMLWRTRLDDQGRRFVYECGSVSAFNVCIVDYVDEDLVAALATNSDECCGWKRTLELANLFRSRPE
jgi:CubicO group peptidase (beta-lactamase class C family)